MAGITQNGQKKIYFHCGPSTKTQKHSREMEKNRKIYISIENIFKLKMAKSLK